MVGGNSKGTERLQGGWGGGAHRGEEGCQSGRLWTIRPFFKEERTVKMTFKGEGGRGRRRRVLIGRKKKSEGKGG